MRDPRPVGIGRRAERQRGGMNRPIAQQVAQRRQDPSGAITKPSRNPASPKNLPNERSTISRRCGATSAARLASGAQSAKASSTISQPPCAS
jgi:hypothetical protein